jgi:hypothetical protein
MEICLQVVERQEKLKECVCKSEEFFYLEKKN